MEKELIIKARDSMSIKGMFYEKQKTNKLVIFLHGITGRIDEYHIKTGIEYFYNRDYAAYAYNQYSDEIVAGKKPRALYEEVTIERHAQDLQDVYEFFKDEYEKIYIIGHSLAGLVMIKANIPCAAQSFWDPCLGAGGFSGKKLYQDYNNSLSIYDNGKLIILNNAMKNSRETFTIEKMKEYWSEFKSEAQIIGAKRAQAAKNIMYSQYIKGSVFEVIDSDHGFTGLGQVKQVCEMTYNWMKDK